MKHYSINFISENDTHFIKIRQERGINTFENSLKSFNFLAIRDERRFFIFIKILESLIQLRFTVFDKSNLILVY